MAEQLMFNIIYDSDSDGEEFRVRRPRVLRDRPDWFEVFDDVDFQTRFRLSKGTTLFVLQQIEDRLEFDSDRNNSLSPVNQLLLALRFYATGSFFKLVGDFSWVSESTAHRVVHRVSVALASLAQEFIKFPETPEEILFTQTAVYDKARFPRAVGLIDCTHVKIISPGGDDAEIYRNRKGFFSLNVQTIGNMNLEITDIVSRWPGSSHDATILHASYRWTRFLDGAYGNALLIGDSGYPLSAYLMTPIESPTTRAEQLFNESHVRSRNPIERLYGVWKRWFPVLALGIRVRLDKVEAIIVATAVLHNISRRNNEDLPPDENLGLLVPWDYILEEGNIAPVAAANPVAGAAERRRQGVQTRNLLVNEHFARLRAAEDNAE